MALSIRKVSDLQKQQDFLDPVVRILNRHIGTSFGRNQWVIVRSDQGSIYRQVRGETAKGFTKHACQLDYDSRLVLGAPDDLVDGWYPCEYEIVECPWYLSWAPYWHHQNRTIGFSLKLAIVAFVISLIGLALGILSLVG